MNDVVAILLISISLIWLVSVTLRSYTLYRITRKNSYNEYKNRKTPTLGDYDFSQEDVGDICDSIDIGDENIGLEGTHDD